MPAEQLGPALVDLARRTGAEAARARREGRPPQPCPWDANGDSITYARMARVWSEAYQAGVGPIPEWPADL